MERGYAAWGFWSWTHWVSASGTSMFKDLTDCWTSHLQFSRRWKRNFCNTLAQNKNTWMHIQTQRLFTLWVRRFGRMDPSAPCMTWQTYTPAPFQLNTLYVHAHINIHRHTHSVHEHTFLWGLVRCPFLLPYGSSAVWLHALLALLHHPALPSDRIFSLYPLFNLFCFLTFTFEF